MNTTNKYNFIKKTILSLSLAIFFTICFPLLSTKTYAATSNQVAIIRLVSTNSDQINLLNQVAYCQQLSSLQLYNYFERQNLGHSWITITNISNNDLLIGTFCCNPGETITVGTWGLWNGEPSGVWINAEAYYADTYNSYDTAYIEAYLTKSQFTKVANYIKANDKYNLRTGYVCSVFAARCWNTALDSIGSDWKVIDSNYTTPKTIYDQIIKVGNRVKKNTNYNILGYNYRLSKTSYVYYMKNNKFQLQNNELNCR